MGANIFANIRNEAGPMSTEAISTIARQHNVPVMVDAAAEILTIPNIHLQRGATLVGYSGGKFIRGPQSAGLRTLAPAAAPKTPTATLTGRWDVDIQYAASTSTHTVHLLQDGDQLQGTHQGNFLARDISGTIDGDAVQLASSVTERHGDSLNYRFTGTVSGDTMSGSLSLGEYLSATRTARRYAPTRPGVSA